MKITPMWKVLSIFHKISSSENNHVIETWTRSKDKVQSVVL